MAIRVLRSLDELSFKATTTPSMKNVTSLGKAADVDIFEYVAAVPADELRGHEIYERFVERVYRTDDGRFDHVMVMTRTKNTYLVVVVDIPANSIYGHHLLDLDDQYGQRSSPRRDGAADDRTVECEAHGTRIGAVLCCHLVRPTESALGFVENSSDPGDLQAWCGGCEEMFVREQEMTPAFRAFNDMCVVCVVCYRRMKRLHSTTN